MKMYCFHPDHYDNEAFVCTESKEKALKYLKASDDYIAKILNSGCGYAIDEYPIGEVVWTEPS
jgi:hypothetical protein